MNGKYPECMLSRYPMLTLCVLLNYQMRRMGLIPDEWYDKDRELLLLYLQGRK